MKSKVILSLIIFVLILSFSYVSAQVPQMINYQGKLTTPGGDLIDDTLSIVFTIYDAATNGGVLWTETQPTVIVENGIFSVLLGSVAPIPDTAFDGSVRYLGIKVGADAEMTPRKAIASVAYAYKSKANGGWVDDGAVVRLDNSSDRVGIGVTPSPAMKLCVLGDSNIAIYGELSPHPEETSDYYGVMSEVWGGMGENYGVLGLAAGSGYNFGLYGISYGPILQMSRGIPQEMGYCYGIVGEAYNYYDIVTGVYGTAGGYGGLFGVVGEATEYQEDGENWNCGVYGYASNADWNYGVVGEAWGDTNSWAGYFFGDVYIEGSLEGPWSLAQIDHPLDPETKYLQHSMVGSPDMMSVYNGNITLDTRGEATVQLPSYFEALNTDFRYQLTCIGGFAPVYVAQKISGNQFTIAGGEPGMEVSWQVTGIRGDPYAEANRIQVEVDKPVMERGKYLHPEAYGLGKEFGTKYEMRKKMEEQQQRNKEQREQRKLSEERRHR